ncbi:uncharacterized protein si:ch1073-456m8.1 isoform X2 [Nerophis ophidion]|uniref:uncharacterized protein si:ch1073-456m8.1 isoform X2 n=1 Tax=Nerophis ophidion TaxID=159077 RepID=UPI002ADF6113|nr:uncharacterized protein si:ch1073-456m8.1 isoform X2 [Nerophis ophidion]
MLSGSVDNSGVDNSGSPKKRTLSRGIAEDESLRSFIKEAESSSRRVSRSESRAGTLKKRPDSQPPDQDLFEGLSEMLELQASYDEALQELRGLEVERHALIFQVDVLQDTLEGVEELLAEAQREAAEANLELGRERDAKRKLQMLVRSLMQEVETLKEAACPSQVSAHSPEPLRNQNPADQGGVTSKLVCASNSAPSLALEPPQCVDGVHRRPHQGGRDPSPDKSDSDTASTYEDASAESPEQDHIFPSVTLELHQGLHQGLDQEGQHGDSCLLS